MNSIMQHCADVYGHAVLHTWSGGCTEGWIRTLQMENCVSIQLKVYISNKRDPCMWIHNILYHVSFTDSEVLIQAIGK